MTLIKIEDVEIQKNKKLDLSSPNVREALRRMRNKNTFKIQEYEKVFDFGKFLLTIFEVSADSNNYRCNVNAESKAKIN